MQYIEYGHSITSFCLVEKKMVCFKDCLGMSKRVKADICIAREQYEHTKWIRIADYGRVSFDDVLKALSHSMTANSQVLRDYLSALNESEVLKGHSYGLSDVI